MKSLGKPSTMKSLYLIVCAVLVICSSIRLCFDTLSSSYRANDVSWGHGVRNSISSSMNTSIAVSTLMHETNTVNLPRKCQDMYNYQNITTNLMPVIVAGYPGSGNDLTRTLVLKLTGFDGNDIYPEEGNCSAAQRAATCKTHYPVYPAYPPHEMRHMFAPTTALLIRNPAKAIPSFYNYIWELNHSISDHTQQAPEDDWILWRDIEFDEQIETWYTLLRYWFDNFYIQTIIPYEQIVNADDGPKIVQQLALQLQSTGFQVASDYECQWYDCVVQSAKVKRAGHKYTPPYTSYQKSLMINVIDKALADFRHHSVLGNVLSQYKSDIESKVRVVD